METNSNSLLIKVEYEKDTFIKEKNDYKKYIFTTDEKTEENNNCPSGQYLSIIKDYTCSDYNYENKMSLENGVILYEIILI